MHRSFLVCLLSCVLALLAACGSEDPPTTEPTGEPTPETPPESASVVRGGQLYDKWWIPAAKRKPRDTHPLWSTRPDAESNQRTGATTWRCKECHGWDYRGVDGAYGGGSHKTGFPGVLGTTLDADALRASLVEAHGYGEDKLAAIDLASLVRFLQEALVDTTQWIDEQNAFRGDAERGKTLYRKGLGGNKACTICHGPRGLKTPDGVPPGYAAWVGKIANENPWEFLHKVRFGHPGADMPAAHGTDATMQDIADVAAYAQTLPQEK